MAPDKEVTATARVTVQIEVVLENPWSPTATVAEIHKTAAREAVETVQHILNGAGAKSRILRVIGEPSVTAILVTK